jgi:ORF021|nr:MAG TPA: ERF superfamily protein [Caudoviricetes sp.]
MLNKSESIENLSKAMSEFQKNLKQPLKDANNPFFKSKYVPLENVVEAITEAAGPLGISFMQFASGDDSGNIEVGTIILHQSGEYIEFPSVRMKPEKQTPQAYGSAITYAKRYALSAVFGITSDKDDDGNEASGNGRKKKGPQISAEKQSKCDYIQQLAESTTERFEKFKEMQSKVQGAPTEEWSDTLLDRAIKMLQSIQEPLTGTREGA